MRYHLTLQSTNVKTGPIPVSTTSARTCPPECPLKGKGCYADAGPLALHWRKVTESARGDEFARFCESIARLPDGQLWRHNQAGDLPGIGSRIDAAALARLAAANTGRHGFTYTHKPVTGKHGPANRAAIAAANAAGFTVNLSANSLAHADELAALDIAPVVAIVPSDTSDSFQTPSGRHGVVCPAQTRDDVTCASCKLCSRRDRRGLIIGFKAHGTHARAVDSIARGGE
jgi:hypothetical protein